MYQIIPVPPFDLVLFGATGDLARREILPGLFRRLCVGQMPRKSRVIGVSRRGISDREFQNFVRSAIVEARACSEGEGEALNAFLDCIKFRSVDGNNARGWPELADCLKNDKVTAHYLSVAPSVFPGIVRNLQLYGMDRKNARIVVEKPFGHDLESSRKLNRILRSTFQESQIYRIDHYLGKETVQNLMALRFANILFEPVWNSQYIDHVQISVAESIGVKGREGYYDAAGAMRDMVQNHLMQLLCLVAMEAPSTFGPDPLRDEKVKVIKALAPVSSKNIVRGQYGVGQGLTSYLEDIGKSTSSTESYVALRCSIRNWRWAGTPFFLRTGKRMNARMSEIAVVFRHPPHSIFKKRMGRKGNVLAIRLQPNEGIKMSITIKEPGPGGMRLVEVPLDMTFSESLGPTFGSLTNAYERLIMDVIRGDQTLFMRSDEVEAAWTWTDSVIATWNREGMRPLQYKAGTDGPDAASAFMRGARQWRPIEE